ncbi:MAG TPA: hypothetical protein VMM78_07770 [Thermomicrobiales bacterium]|nr:hypothetical protein [Thermomicrobiales bacterium]
MNPFMRIFRSVRGFAGGDSAFEAYYGEIIRKQAVGAPSAAEARRDFAAVRSSIQRATTF